jgi:hypothetical protein
MLISIMISTFLDVFTQVTQFLQPADGSSFWNAAFLAS